MPDPASKAVFLSYASQDTKAARSICEALRAVEVEVWFDQIELVGGDQWDAKIRRQIGACALFVPIISANTQGRLEGYFRIEWKLGAQRTHAMAEAKTFLLPVVIDDTRDAEAHVPGEFRAVQWTRLPPAGAMTQFVERVKYLLTAETRSPWPTRLEPPAVAGKRTGLPGWGWGAVAGMAGAGIAAAFFLGHKFEPATVPPKITSEPAHSPPAAVAADNSIAVLPFTNLSDDAADNAFFSEGVHGEVINILAKIHALRVISRTSVMAYKTGGRNVRAIAAELGAALILEGTVQRAGRKVRITAELIDALTDRPLWAESYDRDLTDTFAIQSELAREITNALRAKLTTNEQQLIAQRPTESPEAYDLYLRGRALAQNLGFAGGKEPFGQVVSYYEQAIAKDPKFAAAYLQLSLTHGLLYRFSNLDPTPERLARARTALDQAVRLAPDVAETKLARGVITYLGASDWAGALQDFRAAEADLPNDDQLQWWTGNALRRLGRWDEAIKYFLSSSQLNPKAPAGGIEAVQTLLYLRRFSQAREIAESFLGRFPDSRPLLIDFARVQCCLSGDYEAYVRRMESLPIEPDAVSRLLADYSSATWRRNWAAAEKILSDGRIHSMRETPGLVDAPVSWHRALVAWLDGRPEEAKPFASEALKFYRAGSWNQRQQPWALIGQARAEAILGEADAAIMRGKTAWAMVADRDALAAMTMRPKLAKVYLLLGRREEALTELRAMMSGPSEQTPEEIRHDALWARIDDDPRFEKTLRSARAL